MEKTYNYDRISSKISGLAYTALTPHQSESFSFTLLHTKSQIYLAHYHCIILSPVIIP